MKRFDKGVTSKVQCTSLNAQHVCYRDPQKFVLCFVAHFVDIAGNDVATET